MESTVLHEAQVDGTVVRAVLGDMTLERVDAVVNAANSQLLHGGGLAGAIVRRGGQSIQEESLRLAPVPVGGAVATGAGRLPSRWVIHAVGPRWGEGDEEAKLRSAVRSALDTARELGARSVSLPAISTGIFGYPKADGVAVIMDTCLAWIRAHRGALQELRLVAFDRETVDLFAETLRAATRAS